jgi:hypothetical protein
VSRTPLPVLLTRLRALQYPGGVRVETGDGDNTDWYEVMLFPAASEREIASALGADGKQIPPQLLEFWRASNGANLFINESSLHGVGVASTELLADLQIEEEEVYGKELLKEHLIFARVNGAGDFLVLNVHTGQVLDGVHAEQPEEWKPIAESFNHWLEQLLDANGRYYWIEALYEAAASGGP